MAFSAKSISVTNTPVLLASTTTATVNDPTSVIINNMDPQTILFIGGSAVTTGPISDPNAGTPVFPRSGIALRILNSDSIYGIAVSTVDARVMIGRQ